MSIDEVVVVTGAGRGIGADIARDLGDRGYRIVAISRSWPEKPDGPDGPDLAHITGDIREARVHQRAVEAARDAGRLIGWVNNAAILEHHALHEAPDDSIQNQLDVNLGGTIKGCRAALGEFLRLGGGGTIVNLSSIHSRAAFPGNGVYDATKAGIDAITRNIAVEYGHLGIRANSVAPGAVRSDMLAGAESAASAAAFASLHPLGRIAEQAEISEVVAFLLSPSASFISGASIPVDGAASARVFPFPPHPTVPSSKESS